MDPMIYTIIAAVSGLGIGVVFGRYLLAKFFQRHEQEAKDKAKLILSDAEMKSENLKKEKILEAKTQYLKLKQEFDEEANKKKQIIIQNEQKLKQREQTLAKQLETNQRKEAELDSTKENLTAQLEIVKKRKEEVEKANLQQVAKLEKIANLTAEEARN